MDTRKIANSLIIVTLILIGLYYGKALIMPFIIALVVWYLLNALKQQIAKIRMGGKELPWFLQLGIATVILLTVFIFISGLFKSNFEAFVESYPAYHQKILVLSRDVTHYLELPVSVDELIRKLDLPTLMRDLLNSSVGFASSLALVIIYVLFIMAEERIFGKKLEQIFIDRGKKLRFRSAVREIDRSIRSYVSIKTALCLTSALVSYIVMWIIGVDFAVLWAFLIFFLNYIPIIGAFLGPLFPTIIALIQFDEPTYAIILISVLASIQAVIGNFIEPKVLGDRLNLSPLVVILSLSFWGTLWGIAGMFLCVPITVILMIIFAQFPQTRSIAILLSGGKTV